jgi:hypothetical protein
MDIDQLTTAEQDHHDACHVEHLLSSKELQLASHWRLLTGITACDEMDEDDHITGVGPRPDLEAPNNTAEVEQVQTPAVVEEAHPSVHSGRTPKLPITRPKKRRRSPGGSVLNPIDLTSERHICINGKICELIDLSEDMVLSHEYSRYNPLIHKSNRRKCRSDL